MFDSIDSAAGESKRTTGHLTLPTISSLGTAAFRPLAGLVWSLAPSQNIRGTRKGNGISAFAGRKGHSGSTRPRRAWDVRERLSITHKRFDARRSKSRLTRSSRRPQQKEKAGDCCARFATALRPRLIKPLVGMFGQWMRTDVLGDRIGILDVETARIWAVSNPSSRSRLLLSAQWLAYVAQARHRDRGFSV